MFTQLDEDRPRGLFSLQSINKSNTINMRRILLQLAPRALITTVALVVVVVAVSTNAPRVNAATGTASRTLPASYTVNTPLTVTLGIVPQTAVVVYSLEETPPSGWSVGSMDANCAFDSVNKKVKCGPFFDSTTRTITYVATPPVGETGAKTFSGVVAFDDSPLVTIGGNASITAVATGGGTTPPAGGSNPPAGGGTLPPGGGTNNPPSGGGGSTYVPPSGGGGLSYSSTTGGGSTSGGANSSCASFAYPTITKDLTQGSNGSDVVLLKKILSLEKLMAPSILTNYGSVTAKAVSEYQLKYKIITYGTPSTTGFGSVGPKTRTAINQLILQSKYPSLAICKTAIVPPNTGSNISNNSGTSRIPSTFRFTTSLKLGMTSPSVRYLQIFLNDKGYTVSTSGNGSRGLESTYFGPSTVKALMRFQSAYSSEILKPYGLSLPSGYFGPATIKKVNSLL